MARDTDAGRDTPDGARTRFSLQAATADAPQIRDNLFRLYLYKFQNYAHPDPTVQKRVRAAAAEKIIVGNIRLIYTWVRPFRGLGLSYDELIHHGAMGMLRALEKFDVERGTAFSTYAFWWVRQAAIRGITDTGRTVRVPVHAVTDDVLIERVRRTFANRHGRMPEQHELLAALHEDHTKRGKTLTGDAVAAALSWPRPRILSMDAPLTEDGDTLHEFLGAWPEEHEGLRRSLLEEMLDRLPPRHATVVRKRFGLDGEELTLEELARQFGLTRERVRQIQKDALVRLKKLLGRERLIKAWRALSKG